MTACVRGGSANATTRIFFVIAPKREDAMPSILLVCLRNGTGFLACAVLLGFATAVSADPKPLSKEEQAKVDKAIERAVAYLKRTQTDEGDWPRRWKNIH